MALRNKLLLSIFSIVFLISSLLMVNSYMANQESEHVQDLLDIHHKYTTLLNLKNAMSRQLSMAQEIFIYGKPAEQAELDNVSAQIQGFVKILIEEVSAEKTIVKTDLAEAPISKHEQLRLINIQHQYEDLWRELVLMGKLLEVGRKSKAQDHFSNEINKRYSEIFSHIDQWISVQQQKLSSTEEAFMLVSKRQGTTSFVALIAILVVILLLSGVFMYLLGPRVQDLLAGTERIAQGDFSKPVTVKGNDEFSSLAKSMNQMMSELATSRKKLLEQSYYSGMADVVSGTLHNLGNTLSPMVISLDSISNQVQSTNLERLNLAIKEIGTCQDKERKNDLLEFAKLSCAKQQEKVAGIKKNISQVQDKISVIEKVLTEHSRFTETDRPFELLDLQELLADSLALVRNDYQDQVPILLQFGDPCPEVVFSHHIVLAQVLANLITNAIESVISSNKDDGQVVIRSGFDQSTKDVAHITISDNGQGIEQKMLTRIFERGVSGKKEGYGLGLHWCANSMLSLQGKLYAESEGPGLGACFHVVVSTSKGSIS